MSARAGHTHARHLAHHFDTPEQQREAGKLGMWIFLATEVLLFSGLFCAYAVYRANHPEVFVYAHRFLDKSLGGLNTVILLCSSFTMAWAVRASQLGRRRALVTLLGLTLLGGAGFMGVKVLEYQAKWRHGLLWGRHYAPEAHEPGHAAADPAPPPARAARDVPAILPPAERSTIPPAAVGPAGTVTEGDPEPSGEEIVPANVHWFFGIYFLMTGLHGIHVLGGMGAIGWLALRASRGHFSDAYFTPVDLVGLYWHLVDMIWIFLFPLLYLIH